MALSSKNFRVLTPALALALVAFATEARAQSTTDADAGAAPSGTAAGTDTTAKPPAAKPEDLLHDIAAKPDEKNDADKGAVGAPTDPLVTGSAGARAVGSAPPGSHYGNFMDTRLTWTFGDDDILHPTGQLVPLSPTFNIGDRPQYRLFFDALNSRFAGRENLTHLVMYKKMPGFIPNLETEAAVVLRFDLAALASGTGDLNKALYDSGSYIKIFYKTGGDAKKPSGISAVFLPLDADRMRVGYLYDITWGGSASSINQSIFPRLQGSAPGAKLQFDMPDKFYGFIGFKSGTIVQPAQVLNPGGENDVETVRVGESNYGFLGGLGVDFTENVRLDASGGYFQQGKLDLEDVRGKPVYTLGGAARLVVHGKMPVPQSVDLLLYRNDPNAPMSLFSLPRYTPELTKWSISVEGDFLQQHLKDYDTEGATKNQLAYAMAASAVVETGYLRLSATGIVRNLNFVVRNVPGFIPFETMPSAASTQPELFGALSADYHFPGAHLTPGLGLCVQMPSTFKSEFTDSGLQASRTIVVRQQGDESILPLGQDRRPIVQTRLNIRWDLSTILSAQLWAQIVYDNNSTLVVRDPNEGTASLRVFQDAIRFGLGTSLQARF
jgi:hypothetical protein